MSKASRFDLREMSILILDQEKTNIKREGWCMVKKRKMISEKDRISELTEEVLLEGGDGMRGG